MGLEFGDHPDVVFGDAPLKTVLSQIRFSPILALMTSAGVAGFQAALRDDYPLFLDPVRSANVQVSSTSIGLEAPPPVWRLGDAERHWTVGLAVDFVSLETNQYTDIGEFLDRFGIVLAALRTTLRPSDSVRVGLRKVNFFKSPVSEQTTSLAGIIRPELLGPLAVPAFPAPIAGNASQLEFSDEENMLVVRYGLGSDDDQVGFVLDMDYSTERPYQVDGNEDIIGLLRYYSQGMTSFFHWAVEANHKATLKPRERAGSGSDS